MTRDLPVVAADGDAARSSALNRRVLIGVIIAAVLLGPTFHLVQRPLTVVAGFQLAATVCLTALVLWRFGPSDSVPKATPWAVVGVILALAITLYAVGGQAWLGTLAIGAAVCGRLSRAPGPAAAGAAACSLTGPNGIEVASKLRETGLLAKVVIVTTFDRPGYLRAAMTSGASGFLLKDAPAADLAAAIRQVAAGERVVDPSLAAAALAQGESPLTKREAEVLAAAGHDAIADIAARLYLSPGTARNHLSSAIPRLGARNRAEAAAVAQRKGWL